MSHDVQPVVRYLIPCDDVLTGEAPHHRLSIIGLIHAIRSTHVPPFPQVRPILKVFIQLTGCRGPGRFRIDIVQADTGDVVCRTKTFPVWLPSDPLEVHGIVAEIRGCRFPEPGLYEVQFWYNEESIAQQPIVLR